MELIIVKRKKEKEKSSAKIFSDLTFRTLRNQSF